MDIGLSMSDVMGDWLSVPLLQEEEGKALRAMGLAHPTIVPPGAFARADGATLPIAVQNDREWRALCGKVIGRPELVDDPRLAASVGRVEGREATASGAQGKRIVEQLSQQREPRDVRWS